MNGVVETTVWIAAPPEAVFNLLADPSRFLEWKTGIDSIPEVHGPLTQPGGSYLAIMTTGGRKTPVQFTIERADAPWLHVQHGRTAEGVRPKLETWSTHRLEARDGGTLVRFTFEYTLPFGPLGRVADAVIVRRRLDDEMRLAHERLKAIAEGSS